MLTGTYKMHKYLLNDYAINTPLDFIHLPILFIHMVFV